MFYFLIFAVRGHKMMGRLFLAHGEMCAAHPWEVIVATLTLTVCMLTVEPRAAALPVDQQDTCHWRQNCVGIEVLDSLFYLPM